MSVMDALAAADSVAAGYDSGATVSDDEDDAPASLNRAGPVGRFPGPARLDSERLLERSQHVSPPHKKRKVDSLQEDKYPFGSFLEGRILRTIIPENLNGRDSIVDDIFAAGNLRRILSFAYFVAADFLPRIDRDCKVWLMLDPSMSIDFQAMTLELLRKRDGRTYTKFERGLLSSLDTKDFQAFGRQITTMWRQRLGITNPNFSVAFTIADKGSGCRHTKLHVLEYTDGLRICLTSANSMDVDLVHGDNHFFVQDFERLPVPDNAKQQKKVPTTDFEVQLFAHIDLLGFRNKAFGDLEKKFDFSKAKGDLIASRKSSAELGPTDYGLDRLSRVVMDMVGPKLRSIDKIFVEVNTASMGACRPDWLKTVGKALRGQLGESSTDGVEYIFVVPTKADSKMGIFDRLGDWAAKQIAGKPLKTTLEDPRAGPRIRSLCHRYIPKAKGCAFHSKTIAVFDVDPRLHPTAWPLYVVLGSHNFSIAAWGEGLGPNKDNERVCKGIINTELSIMIDGKVLPTLLGSGSTVDDLFAYQRPPQPWRSSDVPFTGWLLQSPPGTSLTVLPGHGDDA